MTQGDLENLPSAFVAKNQFWQEVQVPCLIEGGGAFRLSRMGWRGRPRRGTGLMRPLQGFLRPGYMKPFSFTCLAAVSICILEFSQGKNKTVWVRFCLFELLMHPVLFFSPGGLRDNWKSSLTFMNPETRNSEVV